MSDVPLVHSVGPLVWENDLIRLEILGYLSDPSDFLNSRLVTKAGFQDAMRSLWKDVTLGQVNWLYTQNCDCDRLSMYLRAIRHLTVPRDSLHRNRLADGTDDDRILILYPSGSKAIIVGSVRAAQEGDIALSQAPDATYFSFRGIGLMPYLETFEIKNCPSKTLLRPYFENDVSMRVAEEYQLGERKIRVVTYYTASSMIDWGRSMIDIANTSSYVKSIQVERPESTRSSWLLRTAVFDGSPRTRWQHVEVFKMAIPITCDQLLQLLQVCRSLNTLDVELYRPPNCGYTQPDSLLELLASSPLAIENVSIRVFPLEWLPYFRYCENLSLEIYENFKPNRPSLPPIRWFTHEPSAIKRLDLEITDVLDEDLPAMSDFIRCHTAAETRIEVRDFIEHAVPREGRWETALGRATSNANAYADLTVSDEAET
ncbi:hypothetical protein FFLO_06988 [Filobasidium floriforme]|uniref:Uncharacterized protein n=1 Tax=Filobasidium floriforme TaxID=5210 RepID=A0A8K0JG92_9TREE|nr:hypothetical protein FFLO_06988 [Filobasidium floriforme]